MEIPNNEKVYYFWSLTLNVFFFEKIRRVPGNSQKYAQSRVNMEIRSMHIYEN